MRINRRDALKTIGAIAGTAAASRLLPACGDDATPGEISTFVFLLMENRSYDHFLGSRTLLEGKPGDGLVDTMGNPDKGGAAIPIYASNADAMCVVDPPHGWDPSRLQWGTGRNDGFAVAYQNRYPTSTGRPPLGYLTRDALPVTHALADAYTSCDRWFSSVLGPTLPNRMYWLGATANGAKSNDDVLRGAFKGVPSIFHRLDAAGVDWKYYYGDIGILNFSEGLDVGRMMRFAPNFFDDAAAGKLAPVVYIDPSFSANDDHPPHHPALGQQLIASIYQALATSPQWPTIQLVLSYDEHGGFYDHVSPPSDAADERPEYRQLGFRVPSLVIGPYARQGYVSSVRRDHTSPLKHLENQYGLAPLTMRDAAAEDLAECVDDQRLKEGKASQPIALPPVEIDETQLPASCQYGGDVQKGPPAHDILAWADAEPKRFAAVDARRYTRDGIYYIAEYLDRHNLGRIRRKR